MSDLTDIDKVLMSSEGIRLYNQIKDKLEQDIMNEKIYNTIKEKNNV